MMKHAMTAICLAVFLVSVPCYALDQQVAKQSDKVKVSAKDLAEIKRQIRLMRAEMADLEEKIEQITGLHDRVYKTEQVPEEEKQSQDSKH